MSKILEDLKALAEDTSPAMYSIASRYSDFCDHDDFNDLSAESRAAIMLISHGITMYGNAMEIIRDDE